MYYCVILPRLAQLPSPALTVDNAGMHIVAIFEEPLASGGVHRQ